VIRDALALLATWAVYAAVLAGAFYVVAWPLRRWVRRGSPPARGGWLAWLAWLLIVVALVALVGPLARGLDRRARIAKARGDVRRLGRALDAYAAHCGGVPPAGAAGSACPVAGGVQVGAVPAALTTGQRNRAGVRAGPFVEFVPRLPEGWSGFGGAYGYVVEGVGHARVCAAGEGVVVDSSSAPTCP
jgi:hypothetical protein